MCAASACVEASDASGTLVLSFGGCSHRWPGSRQGLRGTGTAAATWSAHPPAIHTLIWHVVMHQGVAGMVWASRCPAQLTHSVQASLTDRCMVPGPWSGLPATHIWLTPHM